MSTSDLRELLDREAIGRLKAAYCRYIDTKQWSRLRTLFTSDAVFEGFGSAPDGSGVERFVSGISERFSTAVSAHHCHMPEIDFRGPDSARAIWAMMDYVDLGEGKVLAESPEHRGFVGMGHYEDEYRRTGEGWRFCFTRLTRLRVDLLPLDHPPGRKDLRAASPDWLG